MMSGRVRRLSLLLLGGTEARALDWVLSRRPNRPGLFFQIRLTLLDSAARSPGSISPVISTNSAGVDSGILSD